MGSGRYPEIKQTFEVLAVRSQAGGSVSGELFAQLSTESRSLAWKALSPRRSLSLMLFQSDSGSFSKVLFKNLRKTLSGICWADWFERIQGAVESASAWVEEES